MKSHSIKGHIRRAVNSWLESITDKELAKYLAPRVIVTGGAIVSLWRDEAVHDYDIYFTEKEAARRAAVYYVQKFLENPPPRFKQAVYGDRNIDIFVKELADRVTIFVKSAGAVSEKVVEKGVEYAYFEQPAFTEEQCDDFVQLAAACDESSDAANARDLPQGPAVDLTVQKEPEEDASKPRGRPRKEKYRPIYLSRNAITLSDGIQLIIRFFGDVQEIHKNFDFVHCTAYWKAADPENNIEEILYLPPKMMDAAHNKYLVYIGSKYPIASIIRTRKFIKRGYSINAGQYLKMIFQIQDLDLNDLNVLEEQLTGVDAAYFIQLISALEKAKEDPTLTIDTCYIIKLIDELFN